MFLAFTALLMGGGLAAQASPGAAIAQPTVAAASNLSASTPRAPASAPVKGSWLWPVSPPHHVLRAFAMSGPYAAGHRGVDLAALPGAAVAAPAAGVVRHAGVVVDRGVLSIEHDDGTISSFEPVDSLVEAGERVERGQLVARLSQTIVHAPTGGLHVGARIDGGYLNPLFVFGVLAPAVLLPLGDASRADAAPLTIRSITETKGRTPCRYANSRRTIHAARMRRPA